MKTDWKGIYDPKQVYCPDADTYLLLEAALKEIRSGDRVLEIGTGSGYIAAVLKEVADVIVTDINPHAVFAALTCRPAMRKKSMTGWNMPLMAARMEER